MSRSYDMTLRSRQAAETGRRIVDAAENLLASRPMGSITLQAIAEDADVSVQTVLRHFGSRDGCIEAVESRLRDRIRTQRDTAPEGNADAALDVLLEHYEAEGRLVLNLLAQEASDPMADRAAAEGRSYHRAWVKRCFGPLLGTPDPVKIDALVAATDIYLWKLLRLDLGRSEEEARAVFSHLTRAVLEAR
jgi:AcrR family transcriptional regulator